VYPNNEWLPWKFTICPDNYWDDLKNQRKFLDWAAKQLNVNKMSDWYSITSKVNKTNISSGNFFEELNDIGGSVLLKYKYAGSLPDLLSSVYPEHEWLPWKFPRLPDNFWEDAKNERKFMDWAAKQLNIKEMGDWYNVTFKVNIVVIFLLRFQELSEIGGGSLLKYEYNGSPSVLLSEVYPLYDWLPWKFATTPHNYWNEVKNQRKFLDWAAKKLIVNKMSDWYKITSKVVFQLENIENLGIE
jgi:hypothetical protein